MHGEINLQRLYHQNWLHEQKRMSLSRPPLFLQESV